MAEQASCTSQIKAINPRELTAAAATVPVPITFAAVTFSFAVAVAVSLPRSRAPPAVMRWSLARSSGVPVLFAAGEAGIHFGGPTAGATKAATCKNILNIILTLWSGNFSKIAEIRGKEVHYVKARISTSWSTHLGDAAAIHEPSLPFRRQRALADHRSFCHRRVCRRLKEKTGYYSDNDIAGACNRNPQTMIVLPENEAGVSGDRPPRHANVAIDFGERPEALTRKSQTNSSSDIHLSQFHCAFQNR